MSMGTELQFIRVDAAELGPLAKAEEANLTHYFPNGIVFKG